MRKLVRRLQYWIRRRKAQDELAEEIEIHRAMKQEELERTGLHPAEAADASYRSLGNVLVAREDARRIWVWPWVDRLWQDIGFALRLIRKNPAFTFVAVLSLAVGIGANIAIFTLVNAMFLKALPVREISTLHAIGTIDPSLPRSLAGFDGVSLPNFQDLRSQNTAFVDMAASRLVRFSWKIDKEIRQLQGQIVTMNYFDVLGVEPIQGKTFSADDDQDRHPVAIISYKTSESVVLATIGGLVGFLIAYWTIAYLGNIASEVFEALDLAPDRRVILFALAVSFIAGILFGLAPATAASRSNISEMLHRTHAAGLGLRWGRHRLRGVLLSVEVALSLALLVGGGLFVRVAQAIQKVDYGFEWTKVGYVRVDLQETGYSAEAGKQFYEDVMQRAGAIAGVEEAVVAARTLAKPVYTEDDENIPGYKPISALVTAISPNLFSGFHIPVISGRAFTNFDRGGAIPVAIVSDNTAKHLWPGKDPIGKRFHFAGSETTHEVVGVVPDVGYYTAPNVPLTVYVPVLQVYDPASAVYVYASGTPGPLITPVRRAIEDFDENVVITAAQTISDEVTVGSTKLRVVSTPLQLAGLLALAISVIGIYGVSTYLTAQRTQELGVRFALGAGRYSILRLVLWQGLRPVLAGVVLGLALSRAFVSIFPSTIMLGVSSTDPIAFGGASIVVCGVTLLACFIPAWRATRVDPLTALRYE